MTNTTYPLAMILRHPSSKHSSQVILSILVVAILALTGYNTYQLSHMQAVPPADNSPTAAAGKNSVSNPQPKTATPAVEATDILPSGVPSVYGEELNVSFDDVSPDTPQRADQTIAKLGTFDTEISLNNQEQQRYINALYNLSGGISCEHCCGAQSVIFKNGEPACGCAHSAAMRGLTKYLITKHKDQYSDAEILTEVSKWKTRFFPSQTTNKAQALASQNKEPTYINLAANIHRGIEQNNGGRMVGGC